MDFISQNGRPLKVVVVGGSLAGLMASIVFRRLGHDVLILESSSSSLRIDHGAGLNAGPFAQEFLSRYDLTAEPYSIPSPGIQYLTLDCKVKKFMKFPLAMSSWGALYYRLRANFDGLKSDFCPVTPTMEKERQGKGVIEMSSKVTDVCYKEGRVTVDYRDVEKGTDKSMECDLVIAADGASSTIRQILLPTIQRTYSGYLAWRGLVPENEMSEEAMKIFSTLSTFSYPGGYILCSLIPGENGILEPGKRFVNFVWYSKCPSSTQLTNIMTDSAGRVHRNSIPRGHVRDEIWEAQREHGHDVLNPVFIELINKTRKPFLSMIQDCMSPQAAFFDGKLLLIGDALATFRPHRAMSLNQSGLDCLLLEKLVKGEITLKAWEKQVVQYGRRAQLASRAMGNWYLYGWMSLIFMKSIFALLVAWLPWN